MLRVDVLVLTHFIKGSLRTKCKEPDDNVLLTVHLHSILVCIHPCHTAIHGYVYIYIYTYICTLKHVYHVCLLHPVCLSFSARYDFQHPGTLTRRVFLGLHISKMFDEHGHSRLQFRSSYEHGFEWIFHVTVDFLCSWLCM